ncbi:alpha/beta hydrolase [Actinoplanes sp. NBC_00393]|uniref:alpha/beta hydrolase n=1 Tax=Actinoplanes sp. NBC_00393 TaxID=2975953 RepID=UPI002E23353C
METDVLGWPYERHSIDLGSDDEGPVVATLVRRRAETPTRRAVLHVHGYVDYFFQTHLADFFAERGWDFYALDLRKYGRSLLPHQTPNFTRSLTDYFPELDEAVRIIREEDGHDQLLVSAHSTGGLITSLWAHTRKGRGLVDGLFLNSPFFDFNLPWLVRRPLMAAILAVGGRSPYRRMPVASLGLYGRSLHAEHHGEWDYDLAWKPIMGFPIRMGWLDAIRRGQRRLRAGLSIDVPVLVACSSRTFRGREWHDDVRAADAVLDVEHIARWAPGLGPRVTIARFDGGLHDLTLSGKDVRAEVFRELGRWVDAFLPAPGTAEAGVPPAPEDQAGMITMLEAAEAAVEAAMADEADDKSGTTA